MLKNFNNYISSESFFSVTSHRTILNAMRISWNEDSCFIAQYSTLSILLYSQKGVYALRGN